MEDEERKGSKSKNEENTLNDSVKAASGVAIDEVVSEVLKEKMSDYGMSGQYIREKYVNQAAMNQYKKSYFSGGKTVKDEYTGQTLHFKKASAENKYGKNRYTYHTSDTDHIVPLKDMHQKTKDSVSGRFITDEEFKDILNSQDNFAVTSGHTNRSKGAKSNEQYVKKNDGSLSIEDKKTLIDKANSAEKKLNRSINRQATKNAVKVSHEAGVKASECAAVIGGSVAIVQNVVSVIKDEKSVEDAIGDVVKDVTTSAAVGYGTGFLDTTIKEVMKSSQSQIMQGLSKTNLPMAAITVAVEATKTLGSYFNGEISGVECFEQLGEQGTGMLASALFSTIGQVATREIIGEAATHTILKGVTGTMLGGVLGGVLGYVIASASYRILLSSLKEAKMAREYREATEKACAEHIKMIQAYRAEVEKSIEKYFDTYKRLFDDTFEGIKRSLQIGDVDKYISSTNKIVTGLGKKPLFNSRKEFDSLMQGEAIIKI